jgi:hypothetical protein
MTGDHCFRMQGLDFVEFSELLGWDLLALPPRVANSMLTAALDDAPPFSRNTESERRV